MALSKALGINPDQTTTQIGLDLDHLQTIGVKTLWLVLAVEWAFPSNTTGDSTVLAKYDACINGAISRGMNVAIQAHGNPSWMVTAGGHTYPGNPWHGPDNASERGNWVACLHTFINRYGASKITWVEIWNEPHLLQFWVQGWNVLQYVQLLHDAYVDIKATWPTVKVVGHNSSRNDIGWIQQAKAWSDTTYTQATSAANNYWYDVLGIHPYCGAAGTGYSPDDTSHADETTDYGALDPNYLGYRRMRAEVLTQEGLTKPLAFGEFGYATSTTGTQWFEVTESTRASYITSALTRAAADGYVEYLAVYKHRPAEAVVDYDSSFNIHPSSGATSTETAFTNALTSGGGGGTPATAPVAGYFNGVTRPRIQVLAGFGGTLDPGAGYLHLGIGPGLGTGQLAGPGVGVNEVDITADVRSIDLTERGRPTDIDTADPVTATIVLSNRHGNYDPTNLAGLYVATALFTTTDTDTTPTINSLSYGGPSSSGCTNSVVTASAGGYLHDMGGASAATPNGTNPAVAAGTFSFWNDTPSGAGVYNWQSVRWRMRPDLDTQSTAGYYWAHQGALTSAANTFGNVWYAGLQSRSSLSGNPKALNFTIWGGIGGVSGGATGTVSQAFTGEGDGWQIMAPFSWVAGRTYSLQFSAEPLRGDRWFSLHIKDETTGVVTWHGSIQAGPGDSSYVRGISYNFSELFSQVTPATTCPLLPRATTWFSAPTFSQSASSSSGLTDGSPVRIRVSWAGVAYDRFYGELSDIVMDLDTTPDATATITCLDGLEKLGRAYLPEQAPADDNETTGTRISGLADAAAYPTSLRSVETGYTTLGRTILGANALELMHQVEATEFGVLFVDGSGRLVFYGRHHAALATRSIVVQATFGDSGGNAVGIQALQLARGRDRIFNRVAITREAAPDEPIGRGDDVAPDEPVEQVADNFTSQIVKGILGFPTEVGQLLRNDSEALAEAQYLVQRFSVAANRISQIEVNALRGNWDVLLPLGPLDLVTVTRDYGPNTINSNLQIQGVSESITVSPPSWSMTFSTSNPPAAPALFKLGTAQLGSSTTAKLGW